MIIAANRVRVSLLVGAAAGVVAVVTLLGASEPDPTVDDLIVGRVERGLRTLASSCPESSTELCLVTRSRPPVSRSELPMRCGPDLRAETTAGTRAPVALAAALGNLHATIALADSTGSHSTAARHAYAEAMLAFADHDFEQYVADELPGDLDFRLPESQRRFSDWVSRIQQRGSELRTRYEGIAALDPVVAISARARIGLIPRSVSDRLMATPVPQAFRTSEFAEDIVQAYCDAMTEVSEPLEQSSITELSACVQLARDEAREETSLPRLREITERSRMCFTELAWLAPDRFPLVGETFPPRADYVWQLVRTQIELGNDEHALRLLSAIPRTADTIYDHDLAMGIALRGLRKHADAEAAYGRARAIDGERPEAEYNLAVLFKDHIATTAELDAATAAYRAAINHFERSARRTKGPLRLEAKEQIALTRKTIAQIEKFQLAMNK